MWQIKNNKAPVSLLSFVLNLKFKSKSKKFSFHFSPHFLRQKVSSGWPPACVIGCIVGACVCELVSRDAVRCVLCAEIVAGLALPERTCCLWASGVAVISPLTDSRAGLWRCLQQRRAHGGRWACARSRPQRPYNASRTALSCATRASAAASSSRFRRSALPFMRCAARDPVLLLRVLRYPLPPPVLCPSGG